MTTRKSSKKTSVPKGGAPARKTAAAKSKIKTPFPLPTANVIVVNDKSKPVPVWAPKPIQVTIPDPVQVFPSGPFPVEAVDSPMQAKRKYTVAIALGGNTPTVATITVKEVRGSWVLATNVKVTQGQLEFVSVTKELWLNSGFFSVFSPS